MPRIERISKGNLVYHIINRANARATIFESKDDYKLFESILEEGKERTNLRILSYCIMPNHWHLILYPKHDGELVQFMSWITNTHTRGGTWKRNQSEAAISIRVGINHSFAPKTNIFLLLSDMLNEIQKEQTWSKKLNNGNGQAYGDEKRGRQSRRNFFRHGPYLRRTIIYLG